MLKFLAWFVSFVVLFAFGLLFFGCLFRFTIDTDMRALPFISVTLEFLAFIVSMTMASVGATMYSWTQGKDKDNDGTVV
jgi:hypothetical protein